MRVTGNLMNCKQQTSSAVLSTAVQMYIYMYPLMLMIWSATHTKNISYHRLSPFTQIGKYMLDNVTIPA